MIQTETQERIIELSHKITKNISMVMGNCYLTKEEDDALVEVMRLAKDLHQLIINK